MNGELAKKVRAAAGAAWGTVIIGAVWMTLAYGLWLVILHYKPGLILTLWGSGDLTWPEVQRITLWFFGAFKLEIFAVLLAAIWLSLWHRRLARNA